LGLGSEDAQASGTGTRKLGVSYNPHIGKVSEKGAGCMAARVRGEGTVALIGSAIRKYGEAGARTGGGFLCQVERVPDGGGRPDPVRVSASRGVTYFKAT